MGRLLVALVVTILCVALATVSQGDPPARPEGAPGGPPQPRTSIAPDRVVGIVRSPQGRPLSFVQVRVRDTTGAEAVDETLEDGRFEVTGLEPGWAFVRAYLLGTPSTSSEPDARAAVRTGGGEFTLAIDPGPELVVRDAVLPFDRSGIDEHGVLRIGGRAHSEARLYQTPLPDARQPDGTTRTLTNYGTIEGGALRFRRVRPGLPYTLWIPWTRDVRGTLFEVGPALTPGERVVHLEAGQPIGVEVRWPEIHGSHGGSGPGPRAVFLKRGPVRVEISHSVFPDAALTSVPVPSGRWTVEAYDRIGEGAPTRGSVEVEAGGTCTVELKPDPSRARKGAPSAR